MPLRRGARISLWSRLFLKSRGTSTMPCYSNNTCVRPHPRAKYGFDVLRIHLLHTHRLSPLWQQQLSLFSIASPMINDVRGRMHLSISNTKGWEKIRPIFIMNPTEDVEIFLFAGDICTKNNWPPFFQFSQLGSRSSGTPDFWEWRYWSAGTLLGEINMLCGFCRILSWQLWERPWFAYGTCEGFLPKGHPVRFRESSWSSSAV